MRAVARAGYADHRRKTKRSRLLSAVELVRRFSISYQTLNHYTNLRLLNHVSRKGLRRFYRASEVKRRLRKIKELQNDGYTLRLISERLRG